jgi:hypothetical protein
MVTVTPELSGRIVEILPLPESFADPTMTHQILLDNGALCNVTDSGSIWIEMSEDGQIVTTPIVKYNGLAFGENEVFSTVDLGLVDAHHANLAEFGIEDYLPQMEDSQNEEFQDWGVGAGNVGANIGAGIGRFAQNIAHGAGRVGAGIANVATNVGGGIAGATPAILANAGTHVANVGRGAANVAGHVGNFIAGNHLRTGAMDRFAMENPNATATEMQLAGRDALLNTNREMGNRQNIRQAAAAGAANSATFQPIVQAATNAPLAPVMAAVPPADNPPLQLSESFSAGQQIGTQGQFAEAELVSYARSNNFNLEEFMNGYASLFTPANVPTQLFSEQQKQEQAQDVNFSANEYNRDLDDVASWIGNTSI